MDCDHSSFDKDSQSCLNCGIIIEGNFDDIQVYQNFDGESITAETYFGSSDIHKMKQVGVKKYTKMENTIREHIQSTLSPPSSATEVSTKSKKKNSFILGEQYYIDNLKGKFLYIKNSDYNSKDSTFDNFYKVYKNVILDNKNTECILGNKFYVNNPVKINYSKPCFIFCSSEDVVSSFNKKDLLEKLHDKVFLKDIYTQYKEYISRSTSTDKKRNKSKTYIETFVICVIIHFYLFHEKEKDIDKIIKKCFGLSFKDEESKTLEKISYKKRKTRSHLFSLIDLFNINEVTMQSHITDVIGFIKSIKN